MEAHQDDAIVEAARELSGGASPAWVVSYLRWCLPTIILLRESAPRAPTRKAVRERLEKVIEHAAALAVALRGDLVMYLENAAPHLMAVSGSDVASLLDDISDRAIKAAAAIRPGGGRDKARPLRHSTPRPAPIKAEEFLAMAVFEAWRIVHGSYFGARNSRAITSAAALWRATGAQGSCDWERIFDEVRHVEAKPGAPHPNGSTKESWRWRLQGEAEARARNIR